MNGRNVFVDTWGWIAWTSRHDVAHEQVVRISQGIRADRGRLVTSNFVLGVAHSLTA